MNFLSLSYLFSWSRLFRKGIRAEFEWRRRRICLCRLRAATAAATTTSGSDGRGAATGLAGGADGRAALLRPARWPYRSARTRAPHTLPPVRPSRRRDARTRKERAARAGQSAAAAATPRAAAIPAAAATTASGIARFVLSSFPRLIFFILVTRSLTLSFAFL